MIFTEMQLAGAFIVTPERLEDQRGFFARSYCQHEFEEHGLNPCVAQCNISFNAKQGTVRGMHYQSAPYEETKLVRCTMGAIYDVIVDLRPTSETFRQWMSVELTAKNRLMLYIPEGFAHGFQTLVDDTEIFYQMGTFYKPGAGRGVRWNDPAFEVQWPLPISVIADKDLQYQDFIQ